MPRPREPVPGPTGPLALVTGGSSGIGLALVGELSGRGYRVVVVADDPAVLDLPSRFADSPGPVSGRHVDLATQAGVTELCEELRSSGEPISIAALNAGVTVGGRFWLSELEDHLRLVDLNCRSLVHLARYLVADMVSAGTGHLLLTSSIAADAPGPYQVTYAASKAFVQSFAEGLRHELRGTGVTVTSVLPGPTDTPIFSRGGMASTRIANGRKDSPEVVAGQAVKAALAGRSKVVTGRWVNRAQHVAGRFLPDRVAAFVVARQTEPRWADGKKVS